MSDFYCSLKLQPYSIIPHLEICGHTSIFPIPCQSYILVSDNLRDAKLNSRVSSLASPTHIGTGSQEERADLFLPILGI